MVILPIYSIYFNFMSNNSTIFNLLILFMFIWFLLK